MHRQVRCDVCKGTYLIDAVHIVREQLVDGRVGYGFRCPHCGRMYRFSSITQRGLELLPELRTVREKMRGNVSRRAYPALVERYDALLKRYQREVMGPYTYEEVVSDGTVETSR